MEWKRMCDEKPERGKWYIVINNAGELSVRYYDLLYTEGLNSKKYITLSYMKDWKWGWDHYECDKQKPIEGFTNSRSGSKLINVPQYYMEIPPQPEITPIDRCQCEIFVLQEKLKRLEAERDGGNWNDTRNNQERTEAYHG